MKHDPAELNRAVSFLPVMQTPTQKEKELEEIILEEELNADATRIFIENSFRDGAVNAAGTAITAVLPPVSRFNPDNEHGMKKQAVIDKLVAFFERFFGLGS